MPTVLALFFLAVLALLDATWLPQEGVRAAQAVADAGATSLLAYRQAVVDYLEAHPGFTGTVPDASLTFPWGYRRDARWTNLVQAGGALYVYQASSPPAAEVLDALHRKTLRSFTVGRNAAGRLVSANGFATGITVPAVVPDGALLMVGR